VIVDVVVVLLVIPPADEVGLMGTAVVDGVTLEHFVFVFVFESVAVVFSVVVIAKETLVEYAVVSPSAELVIAAAYVEIVGCMLC